MASQPERRYEAVVLDWEGVAMADSHPDAPTIRRLVGQLCDSGVHVGIRGGRIDDVDARLQVRPAGPGTLWVTSDDGGPHLFQVDALGPRPADPARLPEARTAGPTTDVLVRAFAGSGVTGDAVLHVEPGSVVAVLEGQLARRAAGDVPWPGTDPRWSVTVDGLDADREGGWSALLTVADARFGTSGSPLSGPRDVVTRRVLAAGVYHVDGPDGALLPGPVWHWVGDRPPTRLRRVLDMRSGTLHEEELVGDVTRRSIRFASLARPGTCVLRTELAEASAADPLASPEPSDAATAETTVGATAGATERGTDGAGRVWMRVVGAAGGIVAAASQGSPGGDATVLDRYAAYGAQPGSRPDVAPALQDLARAEARGFDALLAEHRRSWAARWHIADVTITGDDEMQQAVRLALYHLIGSVPDDAEAAVGARGLTGPAYRGHVFWDADVFVLPFVAATHPAAARAMLEYRVRRLSAARAAARAEGRRGARFPWESARTGAEVTPSSIVDRVGRTLQVRTGELEVHITACVAWAVACYLEWTGDAEFAAGPGREVLVDTARYWASRIRLDADGCGHIDGVIGPDEYHEDVDDNVFTNVMARWNLRRAADLPGVAETERRQWRELAGVLSDGYHPEQGRHVQFTGFDALEPLVIADLAPRRPVAADILLGLERVHGSQVVKQADVVMAHHLIPDEMVPGSLAADLAHYEPRTAHGSSLSPGIHASALARAGRTEEALGWLRVAARLDLEDLTQTTAGGVHLATCGSVWQALIHGFLGLRPAGDGLVVDPRLPREWEALAATVVLRGNEVHVRATHTHVEVSPDSAVTVQAAGGAPRRVDPPGDRLSLDRTTGHQG
jgi:trehalose/maltose hydrolase-like predicted phosphorylase